MLDRLKFREFKDSISSENKNNLVIYCVKVSNGIL